MSYRHAAGFCLLTQTIHLLIAKCSKPEARNEMNLEKKKVNARWKVLETWFESLDSKKNSMQIID